MLLSTFPIRVCGCVLALVVPAYLGWFAWHLDLSVWWMAVPFLVANVALAATVAIEVVNNWQRSLPRRAPIDHGDEPRVAILVPTYGEAPALVMRTVVSVLEQDYPPERMLVIVSDDAHSDEMREVVAWLAEANPAADIRYHRPSRDPRVRRGQGKSGNLNSACELLHDEPDVAFVETRDADDLVGDPAFLREAVGLLAADWRRAYVQSIKEARVSPGDPFDNLQPHFYRATLAGKHAANAIFPCGSGLVWRRACLQDIGGFPTWNLVEDLQSGIEALRLGWHGALLPLVGAVAQHAPEDLPNVYKQRGTWALDGLRLAFWKPWTGLTWRQRLHVAAVPMFYLQSFWTLLFLLTPALAAVAGRAPVDAPEVAYLAATAAFALVLEVTAVALHYPRTPLAVWRTRGVWAGLMFVFMRATWLALSFGPRHKPTYRVTRKTDLFAFHWRNVIPHVVTIVLGVGGIAWAVLSGRLTDGWVLATSWWALLYLLLLCLFIRRAWFGVDWNARRAAARELVAARLESARAARMRPEPGMTEAEIRAVALRRLGGDPAAAPRLRGPAGDGR